MKFLPMSIKSVKLNQNLGVKEVDHESPLALYTLITINNAHKLMRSKNMHFTTIYVKPVNQSKDKNYNKYNIEINQSAEVFQC